MNKGLLMFTVIFLSHFFSYSYGQGVQEKLNWKADWITDGQSHDTINQWTAYRKSFSLESQPDLAVLNIAVDSKYWLWVNGQQAVFEGGLKRAPTPGDTYYDELDISRYLKAGENTVAILVWYFGKDGFSHRSSGRSGLLFELVANKTDTIVSDKSWKCVPHVAYLALDEGPQPNYRLPESNVIFDARKDIGDWVLPDYDDHGWTNAVVKGKGGCPPWNRLFKRPVPLWKNYGMKEFKLGYPFVSNGDTVKFRMPYNAQVTPYLEIESGEGRQISILTDNYFGRLPYNVRAEYITRGGKQKYESLGWMNGHEIWFVIPAGIKVNSLGYRETGYDTKFAGSFSCSDGFYGRLWNKARRTLYINMRDTYMDCPDRERAQWWGDVVNEMGQSFYALDLRSHLLARKGIFELMNWQQEDGVIFSPVPGSYDKELPMQMLNSVGYYGFWTYFKYTGDTATIREIYPKVKKYLSVWELDEDGLVVPHEGGWPWVDWGENKDIPILYNTWYYLACKGYALMSKLMNNWHEKNWAEGQMDSIRQNFNRAFWDGKAYRSPGYGGETDDRANAMAVLCGFPDVFQQQLVKGVLKNEEHASPYMEKYVLEALFQLGCPDEALQRMKRRYGKMVDSEHSTLWEGWGAGVDGFGRGTYNHAWSGGALTLLSQYVAGIEPASPGFGTVTIHPQMGALSRSEATVNSVAGIITVQNDFTVPGVFKQKIESPSPVRVYFPIDKYAVASIKINGSRLSPKLLDKFKDEGSINLNEGTNNIIVYYDFE